MTTSRKELVERLVRFDAPLAPTLSALQEFGWDCDEPLVALEASSVRSVLQRYLSGSLTAADVEAWADAIECRDDIHSSDYRDIIFELASPGVTRQLSPSIAEDLLNQIGSHAAEPCAAVNGGGPSRLQSARLVDTVAELGSFGLETS